VGRLYSFREKARKKEIDEIFIFLAFFVGREHSVEQIQGLLLIFFLTIIVFGFVNEPDSLVLHEFE
jgi:hypothetical protein